MTHLFIIHRITELWDTCRHHCLDHPYNLQLMKASLFAMLDVGMFEQAQTVLRRARTLILESPVGTGGGGTTTTKTAMASNNSSDYTSVLPHHLSHAGDEALLRRKQAASVHQAVLRMLSRSACCSSHGAMLADAANFFRTSFVDALVAVADERKALRAAAEEQVLAARREAAQAHALLHQRAASARQVLLRARDREDMQRKAAVLKSWRRLCQIQARDYQRKRRSMTLVCTALMRRGAQALLMSKFVAWSKWSQAAVRARKQATDAAQLAEKLAAQKMIEREAKKELEAKRGPAGVRRGCRSVAACRGEHDSQAAGGDATVRGRGG